MLNKIHTLLSDPEVNFTALYRISQALFGLALILTLPFFLNETEQGLYFTFLSIIAAQVFFELGLNQVIIQNVSSYLGKVGINNSKETSLYANKILLLHSKLIKIYFILAILFALSISLIGNYIFMASEPAIRAIWFFPWNSLVLLTAFNLFLSPFLCFHEGLGRVKEVYKLRLIQTVIGSFASIILIILGFKLYALIALPLTSAIFSTFWLLQNYNIVLAFQKLIQNNPISSFSWFNEIFSLQWRVSLSWVSGYFIFQFLQPVIFVVYGAQVAGQFGISYNILRVASNLSISWISPKLPKLSMLYSSGQKDLMSQHFRKYSIYTIFITLVLLFSINLGHLLLQFISPDLYSRFLDQYSFFILSLICLIDVLVFCLAIYTRAHKEEPFFVISIFSAISTLILASMANLISFIDFLIIRFLINMLIILPWSYLIYRKYKFN